MSQIENIEKYNVGIPKTAPSKLKINMNGMLKINSSTIESTTNFCSCLFFISKYKSNKKNSIIIK